MDAGTVSEWRVKPGDEVHRGDVVAVVETEKSTIEVEIFESGVIEEILVEPGRRVPVGTALARVAATAAVTPLAPPAPPAPLAPPAPPAPPVLRPRPGAERRLAPVVSPVSEAQRVPAQAARFVFSPVVRHLADQLGVRLADIRGTGPGGAVTRADVEAAARTKPPSAGPRVRSSPFARRLALELGIDMAVVSGTGPGGAILEHDVRAAATRPVIAVAPELAAKAGAPAVPMPAEEALPGGPTDRQLAMRKAIGALMARSKREIPHYYLSTTIDMRSAVAWLERTNLERSVTERLVVPVLLLKATALAIRKVPEMNGFMVEEEFVPSEAVHVGVAVSLRSGGVIAPAIHDADKLALGELMVCLRDLVGRARKGVLRSSEMSDPTITVTNLGELGVEAVFGVIYPPQVALVGFGRLSERPWANQGMLGVAPCVTATLSADHRASDGHRGGLFLAEIDHLLQEPERLQ
jgi:pyruvate dehydrogenase E2 component (dihydrolipoamide acetyltransferase)